MFQVLGVHFGVRYSSVPSSNKKSPVETGDVFDCLPYKKRDNYQFINLKPTANLVYSCIFVSDVKVRKNRIT